MKYVLIGKLVNTHGLKGEVRILSDFKYKDKVFIPGMKIYIGRDKVCEEITGYRHHKIFEMITMDGYNDINEVLKYKGEYVFINRSDLVLGDNQYLDEEIIGLSVMVGNSCKGLVKKIENHNGNEILIVENDDKRFLIPYNFDIILSVSLEKKQLEVQDIKGLFE